MAKLLWLASWYPNPYDHFIGDFIQRHADAVSLFTPVELIHVLQIGAYTKVEKSFVQKNKRGNLTEHIHVFAFNPTGIAILDKIRYNLAYQHYYLRILQDFFREYGQPDLIHVHVPIKAGIIARIILGKWRIPYIVSEHGSYYETSAPDHFSTRSKYFQSQTKKIFRDALAVTNVSAAIGKKIEAITGKPITRVIHNVVNTNLFYYKPKETAALFRWIHVSTMHEQKNPEGLLQAFTLLFAKRTDWELLLCGSVNDGLHEHIQSLPYKDKITCTGEISYTEVARQMRRANAFVLFSNHENFPCVIIEALCSGLPVIATNTGGIAEAVDDTNGLLVNVHDVDALTESMNELMERYSRFNRVDIALQASLRYNPSAIGRQFMDLYRGLGFGA